MDDPQDEVINEQEMCLSHITSTLEWNLLYQNIT